MTDKDGVKVVFKTQYVNAWYAFRDDPSVKHGARALGQCTAFAGVL